MKMKIILLIALGIFVTYSGSTQILEEEIANLTEGHILELENLQSSNLAYIKQAGDNNSIITMQQRIDDFSNPILTGQQRTGNWGLLNQNGADHETSLWQSGLGNVALLRLEGSLTFTDVRQTGNENMISSNLNNLSKQLHSVLLDQAGNSNQIQLDVLGNGSNTEVDYSISIRQTGNDLAFKGTYESNMLPVEIHQKSGATGEGMSVTVTTSAFYFPMK